jgi:hypothetical protein
MFNDAGRYSEDADTKLYRVFGYTVTGGAVQGYATGYFIWDLIISVYYVEIMGLGFVAHAACALAVFSLGFVYLLLLLPTHQTTTDFGKAPIRQLLRSNLHPLRALLPLPQHPLVLR